MLVKFKIIACRPLARWPLECSHTVKRLDNSFPHHFAQRCANSQPTHLLGNILTSGIGKRKYPISHVHNCFVFCPTAGQDCPNKWVTVVRQLKGQIFAQVLVK